MPGKSKVLATYQLTYYFLNLIWSKNIWNLLRLNWNLNAIIDKKISLIKKLNFKRKLTGILRKKNVIEAKNGIFWHKGFKIMRPSPWN